MLTDAYAGSNTQLRDTSLQALSVPEGDMLCGHKSILRDLAEQAEQDYADRAAQALVELAQPGE